MAPSDALRRFAAGLALFCATIAPTIAAAASESPTTARPASVAPSYADLADLADNAPLVLRARIASVAVLPPERQTGVRPGRVRVYVEAVTENLLSGPAAIGEALRYLADVPADAKGRPPKLKKQSVLLFARHVAGHPGELQLVAPDAQLTWDPALEARLRAVLVELLAADAPGRIDGVKEAIYVPGNLAGEGETQLFLATADGEPAAITVFHHPGLPTTWGVSFSEVMATTGNAPARDSLTWYRLTCFLPRTLPAGTNVSGTDEDRVQAVADYAKVVSDLGNCTRTRGK